MIGTHTKPGALPKSLRPETLTRMSLSCRFGWHHWQWGAISPGRLFQERTCMRCGRSEERER